MELRCPKRSYNVILNDFSPLAGRIQRCRPREPLSRPVDIVDLDALIDYLQYLPAPITAPTEIRIAPVTR